MSYPSHDGVAARQDSMPDEELLAAVRGGDTGAYAALYRRHLGAALAHARRLVGSHDGQDVAQEAFLKVLRAITRGGGPQDGFAAYLMRAVHNEAIDRLRRSREAAVDDVEAAAAVEAMEASASAVSVDGGEQLDRDLMRRAFSTLPEQWQRILWLTEVDGLPPREVAPQLRRSPNAVAQLSRRAREGLRTAWLQAHVDGTPMGPGCRQTAGELGAYERGQLSASRAERITAHLEDCVRCSVALRDLRALSTRMRGVLLPLVLGSPLLLDELSEALPLAEQPGAPVAVLEAATAATAAAEAGGAASGRSWWRVTAAGAGVPVAAAGVAVLVGAAGLVLASQSPGNDSAALTPLQEMANSRAVDVAPLTAHDPAEPAVPTLLPAVVEGEDAPALEGPAGGPGDAADGAPTPSASPGGGAASARPEPATAPGSSPAVDVSPAAEVPPAVDVPPPGDLPPAADAPPRVEVPPAPGSSPVPIGGSAAEGVNAPPSKPVPPTVPDPPFVGEPTTGPPIPPPPPDPPFLGGGAPPWLPEDPAPLPEDPAEPPGEPDPPAEDSDPPVEDPAPPAE